MATRSAIGERASSAESTSALETLLGDTTHRVRAPRASPQPSFGGATSRACIRDPAGSASRMAASSSASVGCAAPHPPAHGGRLRRPHSSRREVACRPHTGRPSCVGLSLQQACAPQPPAESESQQRASRIGVSKKAGRGGAPPLPLSPFTAGLAPLLQPPPPPPSASPTTAARAAAAAAPPASISMAVSEGATRPAAMSPLATAPPAAAASETVAPAFTGAASPSSGASCVNSAPSSVAAAARSGSTSFRAVSSPCRRAAVQSCGYGLSPAAALCSGSR
mmetsp:Transcript_14856/g.48050  ORF Transcript_14856/g.48050 Transcript_14856/m.48050 type:complete len:280 (-) Transcript_14856:939-1778(-)